MKRWCIVLLFFCFLGVSASANASDGFFKGGFILKPSEGIDISDRWLVAFGTDYIIADQFSLGFELQTAYYSDEFASVTLRYVPLNGWVNFKYKAPFEPARPFVGGGFGLISTFFSADSESDYISDFGFHLVGGVELGSIDGAAFLLELQGQQNLSADDSEFTIIFFAGVKF